MQHYLRLFLVVLFIIVTNDLPAQNVGINTTLPHSSAVLDIQSINRGILIPRMTTAERVAIPGPATGLMVFDNTTNSFWYRRPAGWEQVMDFANSQWIDDGTTIRPVNATRLTITPNSLAGQGRLNVIAETASPSTQTSIVQLIRGTTGTAVPGLAGSLDFLTEQSNGGYATSARVVCETINTTPGNQTASLEFFTAAGGVTNSQLYLGPANVGIGTSFPSIFSKLDVNGTINTSGKVTRGTVTGNANLVPLCYGAIDAAGNITSGTGNFTVSKFAVGIYVISNPNLDANCIVVVTSRSAGIDNLTVRMFTTTFYDGDLWVISANFSADFADAGFHFTVYKQ
jgi:hypothetical protein